MRNRRVMQCATALLTASWLLCSSVTFAAELSLNEAVDLALSRNPKIKIALKGEEKAKANLDSAKGIQKPSISASTSMGISDVNDVGSTRNNSNRLQLSLPLYTGGKNEMTIAKAVDTVTSSELGLQLAKENLILETVLAYYKILETQKIVKVDAETVNNYQKHLQNVQQLFAAGSTPKVDLLRSEVELVNAEQNLLKAQNNYDVAVSTLKSIIKMDDNETLSLTDEASYTVYDLSLAECIDFARSNRKDLMQSQVALRQAEKDVEIAKSGKLPSVSLGVSNGWDKQLLPDNDNHSLTASVSASWNIFDGNITNANIKAAEIAVEEAQLTLEKDTDAAELEVREAYLNMKEAEKRFHTTKVAVQKAEEDAYIATEKYRVGEGIMLDIIDAQLSLSTAKTNYIQAQYDYVTYKAKLKNAMGNSEVE